MSVQRRRAPSMVALLASTITHRTIRQSSPQMRPPACSSSSPYNLSLSLTCKHSRLFLSLSHTHTENAQHLYLYSRTPSCCWVKRSRARSRSRGAASLSSYSMPVTASSHYVTTCLTVLIRYPLFQMVDTGCRWFRLNGRVWYFTSWQFNIRGVARFPFWRGY